MPSDVTGVKAVNTANAFAQAYLDDQVDIKFAKSQQATAGILSHLDQMRREEGRAIRDMQDDVTSANDDESTTAVLDKLSGAALIEGENKQARLRLG